MTENATERPASATGEVLDYLDGLRLSGAVNMFGASPYLQAEFDYSYTAAQEALLYWMKTFSTRGEAGPVDKGVDVHTF